MKQEAGANPSLLETIAKLQKGLNLGGLSK